VSVSELNPVSHWTCDETSGVRYDSEATTSNDLADINTVGSAVGLLGNACDFESSSSEYLAITDASQIGLEPSGSFSISTWIKQESLPSANTLRAIIGKTQLNNSSSWSLNVYNNAGTQSVDFDARKSSSEPAELLAPGAPSVSTWYNIVARFVSASYMQIWVNNTLVGSMSTVRTNPANNSMDVRLGATNAPGNYFDGLIDETTFFNYAISTATISLIYNSGIPLPYDAPVSDVTACIYANMCTMNDVIGQTCVTDGATTTCSYQNSPTTTPVEVSSDNIILALSVIVFFVATIWVGFMFLPFRKK